MPTYEYQCGACGHQFEAFQKITDAPIKECPNCHEASVNKLVSAAGFQLKGSGWYMTDYRDQSKKKTATETAGTASDAKKTEETSKTPPKDSSTDKS